MYLNIKCKAVKFFYENIGYDLYKLQIRKRFLFFSFLFFYCYSITVVCLFSPSLHSTPGEPTSLPQLHLERTHGQNQGGGWRKRFLRFAIKSTVHKTHIARLKFIKINSFCSLKENVKRIKSNHRLEKHLQVIYMINYLYQAHIRNSQNTVIKKIPINTCEET